MLALARGVVGFYRYVGILFLLGIQPFNDALTHQVIGLHLSGIQIFNMLPGEEKPAVLSNYQWPPQPSLVTVDDDIVHILVQTQIDLVGNHAAAPSLSYLLDKVIRAVMGSHQVPVNINLGVFCLLALDLLDSQVREQHLHHVLVRPL